MSESEPSPPSTSEAVPRWLLYAVSFWGGLQIMVLEMCGFRVLQTHLGSSVVVTGTLLTVVMILLAAGYYTGGQLSQKLGTARGLFGLLVIGALYTEVVTTLLLEPISSLGLESARKAFMATVSPFFTSSAAFLRSISSNISDRLRSESYRLPV